MTFTSHPARHPAVQLSLGPVFGAPDLSTGTVAVFARPARGVEIAWAFPWLPGCWRGVERVALVAVMRDGSVRTGSARPSGQASRVLATLLRAAAAGPVASHAQLQGDDPSFWRIDAWTGSRPFERHLFATQAAGMTEAEFFGWPPEPQPDVQEAFDCEDVTDEDLVALDMELDAPWDQAPDMDDDLGWLEDCGFEADHEAEIGQWLLRVRHEPSHLLAGSGRAVTRPGQGGRSPFERLALQTEGDVCLTLGRIAERLLPLRLRAVAEEFSALPLDLLHTWFPVVPARGSWRLQALRAMPPCLRPLAYVKGDAALLEAIDAGAPLAVALAHLLGLPEAAARQLLRCASLQAEAGYEAHHLRAVLPALACLPPRNWPRTGTGWRRLYCVSRAAASRLADSGPASAALFTLLQAQEPPAAERLANRTLRWLLAVHRAQPDGDAVSFVCATLQGLAPSTVVELARLAARLRQNPRYRQSLVAASNGRGGAFHFDQVWSAFPQAWLHASIDGFDFEIVPTLRGVRAWGHRVGNCLARHGEDMLWLDAIVAVRRKSAAASPVSSLQVSLAKVMPRLRGRGMSPFQHHETSGRDPVMPAGLARAARVFVALLRTRLATAACADLRQQIDDCFVVGAGSLRTHDPQPTRDEHWRVFAKEVLARVVIMNSQQHKKWRNFS